MAQEKKGERRSAEVANGETVALAAGVLLAAFALPKLLSFGRRSVRGIGGMTYRTGVPGSVRPAADPARGRPA